MTRDELLQLHQTACDTARQTMSAKNHDYTGARGDDPFANFRGSLFLGVEPEIGLMLRVTDKLKRVQTFVENGTLAVKAESVDDAIEDVINYMVLLKGLVIERRELQKP